MGRRTVEYKKLCLNVKKFRHLKRFLPSAGEKKGRRINSWIADKNGAESHKRNHKSVTEHGKNVICFLLLSSLHSLMKPAGIFTRGQRITAERKRNHYK